jgi:hypothetical protein
LSKSFRVASRIASSLNPSNNDTEDHTPGRIRYISTSKAIP